MNAAARDDDSCRFVLLTPPGRGAVASLLVEGTGAAEVVGRLVRPLSGRPLADSSIDEIVVGRVIGDGGPGEEVVVARRGESAVEVHCHGGWGARAALAEALARAGCREMSWPAHAIAKAEGPLEAEARLALARARTLPAAAALLDQARGALRREIEAILALLAAADLADASRRLIDLQRSSRWGRRLAVPFSVVLAGPPNVGKSSLVNAILGFRRSIVHEEPGTTRDVLTAVTAIDGWAVELADTAGLRAADDPLESAAAERARQRLADADLTLFVFDASQPWSAADEALWRSRSAALVVHNKCDLAAARGERPAGLLTSALTGEGLPELLAAVARALVPSPLRPGEPIPFTDRQAAAIDRAVASLRASDANAAAADLRNLLAVGPSTS
jgi:tRNA modification GTPase